MEKGTLSFYVNRAKGEGQTGQFQAAVWTMNGFPSYFPTESLDPAVSPYLVGPPTSNPDNLGRFLGPSLQCDNDPATWQPVSVSFAVPVGTDYVAIGLLATGTSNGYYFDDVSLTFAPEPSAVAMLLGAGLFPLGRRLWYVRRMRQRSLSGDHPLIRCRKTITK